jgi:hypothetical protein
MASAAEVTELLSFLSDSRDDVRKLAAQHVLSLTGDDAGLELLVQAGAVEPLCRLVGGDAHLSRFAVSALINLCSSNKAVVHMLSKKMVGRLMDGLKVCERWRAVRVSRRCEVNAVAVSRVCRRTPSARTSAST